MVNLDYLFNSDAVKKIFFDRNYFSDKKLSFSIIENGMILPHKLNIPGIKNGGGIVDGNGEYIKSSFWHYGFGQAYIPPANQFYTVPKQSSIWVSFFMCGDMLLRIIFAVCGFCKATTSRNLLKIARWFISHGKESLLRGNEILHAC